MSKPMLSQCKESMLNGEQQPFSAFVHCSYSRKILACTRSRVILFLMLFHHYGLQYCRTRNSKACEVLNLGCFNLSLSFIIAQHVCVLFLDDKKYPVTAESTSRYRATNSRHSSELDNRRDKRWYPREHSFSSTG